MRGAGVHVYAFSRSDDISPNLISLESFGRTRHSDRNNFGEKYPRNQYQRLSHLSEWKEGVWVAPIAERMTKSGAANIAQPHATGRDHLHHRINLGVNH